MAKPIHNLATMLRTVSGIWLVPFRPRICFLWDHSKYTGRQPPLLLARRIVIPMLISCEPPGAKSSIYLFRIMKMSWRNKRRTRFMVLIFRGYHIYGRKCAAHGAPLRTWEHILSADRVSRSPQPRLGSTLVHWARVPSNFAATESRQTKGTWRPCQIGIIQLLYRFQSLSGASGPPKLVTWFKR